MSEADSRRKHALECLRLSADCMQLAGDAPTPELQRHYLQMAQTWSALAESGPDGAARIADPDEDADPSA